MDRVIRRAGGGVSAVAAHVGDGFPSVVLLHGFPFDHTMWSAQLVALRRHGTLLAPDLPGMGRSELPSTQFAPLTMADYAADVVAWMDHFGFLRPVVVGLSMGGYIAFELWRRYRSRVGALVLMDTKPQADGPEAQAGRRAMADTIQAGGMAAVVDGMIEKVLGATTRQTRPDVVERLRRVILATEPAGAVAALHAMMYRADSSADLATIDVPTAVIVGEEDALTPVEVAREMADGIPGATFRAVPGAGHVSAMEAPDVVSTALSEFLDGLPRP